MCYNQRMTYGRGLKIVFIILFIAAAALGLARKVFSPEIPEINSNPSSSSTLEDFYQSAQRAAPIPTPSATSKDSLIFPDSATASDMHKAQEIKVK